MNCINESIKALPWMGLDQLRSKNLKVVDCTGRQVAWVRDAYQDPEGVHVLVLGPALSETGLEKCIFEAKDSVAEFYAYLHGARLVPQ